MPIEIILVQTSLDKAILVFDGRILEIFHTLWGAKTARYHVAHISAIQIVTDKKGAHTLSLKAKSDAAIISVEASALLDVQQLVAAVQQAMTAYP